MASSRPRGPLPLLLGLGLLALGLFFVRARLEPASLRPLSRADQFSAPRALQRLHAILGDDRPHPVGSPAADAVRARLLAELTALGIPAQVHRGFACSTRGASCGDVGDVVARLPGTRSGPAVLVSAHHDSVAAGPGAGDDGAGVAAILELARVLALGPPLRNPVILLFVDGEEAGLLGAEAFIDTHPWAADIGVAVNLDAGGTRGVTSITRTSAANARVIDPFVAAVPRPYGASVIGAVYSLTPYDTDFSVYDRADIPSIDLGFGEDKAHYHTHLDRLANLDPPSVQHLGDTALALVRALADADLTADPAAASPRVFIDALGFAMLAWPAPWTPALAALALALLSLATWRIRHVQKDTLQPPLTSPTLTPSALTSPLLTSPALSSPLLTSPTLSSPLLTSPTFTSHSSLTARSRLLTVLALPLLLLGPALFAGGLAWFLGYATDAAVPGHAHPWPARLAIGSAALAISGLLATWLTRRLGPARLTLALWWTLALLTAALAVFAPAASVGLLPPVLAAAALLALGALLAPRALSKATWQAEVLHRLCLFLPALLWVQAGARVEAIFGLGPAAVAVLALVFALLAPLWPTHPRPLLPLLALLSLLGVVLTLKTPAFSDDRPRRLSLVFHQDADTGSARWLLDGERRLPPALTALADFTRAPAFPWTPPDEPSWISPAAPALGAPPELTLESGTSDVPVIHGPWGRYLRLHLRSPRGARSAALVIPDDAGLRWLAIAGHTVPPYPEHRRAWYPGVRHHSIVAIPPDGLRIELVVHSTDPVRLTVLDIRDDLPPSAASLLQARPSWAIPSHGGDRSLYSRSFSY